MLLFTFCHVVALLNSPLDVWRPWGDNESTRDKTPDNDLPTGKIFAWVKAFDSKMILQSTLAVDQEKSCQNLQVASAPIHITENKICNQSFSRTF